jgi:hypothetical protein
MFRSVSLTAAAILAAVAAAPAHGLILVWKWYQPWTPPRASHHSVVQNCAGAAVPFAPIALDDWICGQSGPIVRVRWWGTLDTTQTLVGPSQFYIAIWSHSATACLPSARVYSACVNPTKVRVGTDCENRPVYRMSALLPSPFTQTAGTHYWIQISEVDAGSPRLGVPDWKWSAHRPLRECDAVQFAGGVFTQPILDPCDALKNDLAFWILSNSVSGGVTVNNPLPPPILTVDVRRPSDFALLERHTIEPAPDGSFDFSPEGVEGPVLLVFKAPGAIPEARTAVIADGSPIDIGLINPKYGDGNNDGQISFADITQALSNFGLP